MSHEDYNRDSVDAVLARMEAKLDAALARQGEHEGRIAAVEKKQYWLSGVGAALAFIASKLWK